MNINKTVNGTKAILCVEGRIDTSTAPELEKEITQLSEQVNEITIDCADLVYVSSAGLRVFLSTHKAQDKKGGKLVLKNVSEDIMEIFSITGFSSILNIDQ